MTVRVAAGFVSASVTLHAWGAAIDGIAEAQAPALDPAHAVRLSCACEALRHVADAAEADPRSLRRPFVDDLRVLLVRLAHDVTRFAAGGNVVALRGPELSDAVAMAAVAVADLAEALPSPGFEPRDGNVDVPRTGRIAKRPMLDWVASSVEAVNALDDVLFSDPAFLVPEYVGLVRDGRSLAASVPVVALALSDAALVESDFISDRLDALSAACDRAASRMDSLSAAGTPVPGPLRLAVASFATLVEAGMDLADAAFADHAPYAVTWRLLSRGRAVVSDLDVARLFTRESGAQSLDLPTAKAFGRVARSLRTEWAA